jgi:hypothetical protein
MGRIFLIILVVILVALGFGYFHYFFSRGNGVKSGVLIQFQQEGTLFKTYEGEIASASMKNMSTKTFKFSVSDQKIADSLMKCTDKELTLHFEKFKGALPWRGADYLANSAEGGSSTPCAQYIVDRIESVRENNVINQNFAPAQQQAPQQIQQPAPVQAPALQAPAPVEAVPATVTQ